MGDSTQGQSDVDALLAANWAGNSMPFDHAILVLRRIEQTGSDAGLGFVVEVLTLWIKAEAEIYGWKTGGKDCQDKVVKPVISWWLGTCRGGNTVLTVEQKYRPPASRLASKLEESYWKLFGDIRAANQLLCET